MTDKEQEVLEIAKQSMEEYSEAMNELADLERKEFYRFFAIDYFATGEGRSIWLKICRNYRPFETADGEVADWDLKNWKEFVKHDYYLHGTENPTEEEFMSKYSHMLPEHIKVMIERRDQPIFDWEMHYHFNYS